MQRYFDRAYSISAARSLSAPLDAGVNTAAAAIVYATWHPQRREEKLDYGDVQTMVPQRPGREYRR